jgi:WG containing repeat
MAILPLSSCGNNIFPRSISSSDPVKTATSKNLDRFLFRENGKLGYISRTGKIVISAKFDSAHNFSEGLAAVNIGAKWGFIDPMGKIVIPARFDYVYNFSDGLAAVEVDRKWGFIDSTGKIVIPVDLEGSGSFKNGFAYITFLLLVAIRLRSIKLVRSSLRHLPIQRKKQLRAKVMDW